MTKQCAPYGREPGGWRTRLPLRAAVGQSEPDWSTSRPSVVETNQKSAAQTLLSLCAVSELETIGHQLQGLGTGLDQVQHAAGGADQRAQDIAGRAAALGMMGVAIGIQGVQQGIIEIRQRLGAVGQAISTATGLVAGAPPRPSPDQVEGALSPATEQLGSASTGLTGVAQQVEQVQQQAYATLAGGDPGPLVQALEQIKHLALEVAQRCAGVRQTIDQMIAQVRQTGRSGN